ncbi:sensor protein [Arthrobacter crystallopoietes BAB-32]|uniref:histidine kinase n=1 Tax=Arthrobacter crystallopoietes BAB-32 TaxID=1246476 RepID=N1V1W5_9MICC|nr:DUF4118 domain-containing protein [Arthrobacter crystallopoietes]EMY35305.1 sensor protein [Arthrobacter crystallopoietes BAB-32]
MDADAQQEADGQGGPGDRVVVGLAGGSEGLELIRTGARLTGPAGTGRLHAVHIRTGQAAGELPNELDLQRALVADLGGTYHAIGSDDPAQALLDFARSVEAGQLVLGHSRRQGWPGVFRRSTAARLIRQAGGIELHLVPHGETPGPTPPRRRPNWLGRGRLVAGFALAVLLPAALQLLLRLWHHGHFATDMLVQLTGTIAVALVGGLWPALVAAVLSSLMVNFFAVQPVGSMDISDPENLLALLIFLAVAAAVSLVVGLSARRSREAAAAGAEAAALAELSRSTLAAQDSRGEFLERIREHFQAAGAGLYVRGDGRSGGWQLVQSAGAVAESAHANDNAEQLDEARMLALNGRPLTPRERRLFAAFGAHLLALLQRDQLRASQRNLLRLAEDNRMRTSILRAVSHDLRTPLAGIKLAVSSLRQDAVRLPPEDEAELLATIEDYTDRLDGLVGNLLDMSRLSAESVTPLVRPVYWSDAVADALRGLPAERLRVALEDNLPPVDADPGMLERVIANVVENGLKHSGGSDVVISASLGSAGSATVEGRPASELRITDHGPGVPAAKLAQMFKPFQRLGDTPAGSGIGLGLAVAQGFAEAMGGQLQAEQTPGGGLTMVIKLPLSAGSGMEAEPWPTS